MIKVAVELHPYGNEEKKKMLYEIHIVNDGTGNNEQGNYNYKIFNVEKKKRLLNTGWIGEFDRSKGVLKLLQKILTKE